MTALYVLLPDGREDAAWGREVQRGIRAWNQARKGGDYQMQFRATVYASPVAASYSEGDMNPEVMLALLRQIDWAYPARLSYRTESENSWSFVTLGLSLKPELGEA